MKIDSHLVFKRIVVDSVPIDGEFKIVKGSGDLVSELFVDGIAQARLPDGTILKAPIVYPYRKVEKFIIEMPTKHEPTEEEL